VPWPFTVSDSPCVATPLANTSRISGAISASCANFACAGIVGFDVRHIDDHRAERRKFRIVAIGSESLLPSGDKIREPQCLIIARHDDEEWLPWFAEPAHLRLEHIDINIRLRQHDPS